MRKYRSHKVVHAAKILDAEKEVDGTWSIILEGNVHEVISLEESGRFVIREDDLGYLVLYADGYRSWSPTKAFIEGYSAIEGDDLEAVKDVGGALLSFGAAILSLKVGMKVARAGWNGKDMWLVLVGGTPEMELTEGTIYHRAGLKSVAIDPHIDMMTAQGTMQPGWLASQADMLANDWHVVD